MSDTWDVVVVGAGPPGENAADYACRRSGRTAVLVEQELVGGECSYWACMPSKALLRPIELMDEAAHVGGVAQAVEGRRIDVGAVIERRDAFTSHHDDGSQVRWAENAGIGVVRGHGRLAGLRAVEVPASDGSVRTLHARHAVVLATGTRAAVPPVPGMREARPWTSRDVTNLREVPRRAVVVGGGVVACEAATWLHGLGCEKLVIVEMADRLLGRTEPFAAEIVAGRLAEWGVDVRCGAGVARVERPQVHDPSTAGIGVRHGGEVTVVLDGGGTIVADEVVVAAGRVPNSDDIGLETVGVAPDERGYVRVDRHMGVIGVEGGPRGRGWLYAVGDLCGKALLTHMGKYQARIAGDVIAARAEGRATDGDRYSDLADESAVPQVVFTDPEVASVGLTAAAAADAGHDVETVDFDAAGVAGAALARDDYVGRARLVVDRGTDTLLGATFVGDGVAELVHSATVAVVGKVPVPTLWHAVPSYPTVSEVWLRLLEALREQRGGRS